MLGSDLGQKAIIAQMDDLRWTWKADHWERFFYAPLYLIEVTARGQVVVADWQHPVVDVYEEKDGWNKVRSIQVPLAGPEMSQKERLNLESIAKKGGFTCKIPDHLPALGSIDSLGKYLIVSRYNRQENTRVKSLVYDEAFQQVAWFEMTFADLYFLEFFNDGFASVDLEDDGYRIRFHKTRLPH